ncbi:MAG: ATP-dependent helicase [Agathobacter sp.]|nr:ATP-dependent helicase [Agathobacter sp.]
MNFNEAQKAAIEHKDGPMLVLAGPGSGKTATLVERTKNLITKHGVNPTNILVITFTKAAANEMKQRFQKEMKAELSNVTFGTFHAIFFLILKLAYHYNSTNIITDEVKFQAMRELISRYGLQYLDENELISGIFAEISMIKNSRIPLEHFYSTQCGENVFRKIYRDYDAFLKKHQLIDFDDMLTLTYELFTERPDILNAWQKKYPYILVDEFQDINQIQYDIIRLMAAPHNNLFMVGDDDQSIYRFRGSKPEIMLHVPKDYPEVKKIALPINYRCPKAIVETSQKLILHNKERFPKEVFAWKEEKTTGKKDMSVRFLTFKNQQEETYFIIKEIERRLKKGLALSDIAILFRTNMQPRFLMEQLMAYNVDFKTKDQIPNLYDHWIAKDIHAYIAIARGSRERKDFLMIINKPKRYISRDSLYEKQVDMEEWEKLYDDQPWIAERIEKLHYDIKLLAKMSPYSAINYIRHGIGYEEYLEEYAQYRNLNKEDLLDVLDELQASAKGYKSYDAWETHINEYTKELKDRAKSKKENPNAITLATLHSAKGLEFRSVFITDANQGVMPYKKAVLDKDVEEERRLFYVGMTRAIDDLTICAVEELRNKTTEVSQFVIESGIIEDNVSSQI